MAVDRILLVSLDNLGDLVFASALPPALAARFPGAAIDVWCKAYTADVAAMIPATRAVIAADPFWDRAPGRAKGAVLPFLGALRRVRAVRYDVAVIAAAPWRTAAAVAATRIPMRIGLTRRKNRAFLTHALPHEDPSEPVMREIGRLLAPLGGAADGLRYRLDATRLAARRARLSATMGTRSAALHPFASKRNRCVPLAEWIVLARLLAERGFDPFWVGSSPELDEVRAAGAPPGARYADRDTDGTLADSAAALSLAALFVGHDSGPLHVASAFGVPVVGVFAPGEPLRTFPQGVGASRIIARSSPAGISATAMVREVDALGTATDRRAASVTA